MNYKELIKSLKNATCFQDVNQRRNEIANIIPEITIMFEYDQCNHAHQYDLWRHCVETMLNLPGDIEEDVLYLAALLHDIGKPDSRCDGKRPDDTNKHYYGHQKKSMEIVRDMIIPRLEECDDSFTSVEKRKLLYYVEYHDDHVNLRIGHLKRHLEKVSFGEFQNLMHLQVADAKAHVMLPMIEERIRICEQLAGDYGKKLYSELLKNNE